MKKNYIELQSLIGEVELRTEIPTPETTDIQCGYLSIVTWRGHEYTWVDSELGTEYDRHIFVRTADSGHLKLDDAATHIERLPE